MTSAHRLICVVVILSLLHVMILPAAAQNTGLDGGHLTVSSVPSGLTVYVDDAPVGTTPVTGYAAAAGRHTVRVANPNQTDWDMRDWVREMTVIPGETVNAHAVFVGIVTVMSRPFDAAVSLDGELAGTTPLRLRNLTPGLHTISIQKRGYEAVTLSVVMSDTAHQTLTTELKPAGEAPRVSSLLNGNDASSRSRHILGYTTLGVGLVLSGLALAARQRANRAYDRYQQTGDPVELERYYRQANRDDNIAGVFIGVAQANFLASFYFFFISRIFRSEVPKPGTDR